MLSGKTVVVTGGSRGIGKEICLAFAKKGANIVVNYSSTNPDEFVKEIEALGVKAISVQGNVGSFSDAKNIIDVAKKTFGTVDVVVNNAGITRDNLLMGMKEAEFDDVIEVNLKGTFNIMRHSIKHMLKQKGGAIINISSVSGILGNAGQANYSASKAGIIGLTKSTAREVAKKGVTVNAVAPGFITTDMTDVLGDDVKDAVLNNIPLNKFGSTEDVANAVVFLAENNYITGQVISVDGGMSM